MKLIVPDYVAQADHRYFEEWARRMGMKAYDRARGELHGDILLADSVNLITDLPSDRGFTSFYRTGFCLYREKAWIGSSWDYGPSEKEFFGLTERGKQDVRIAEALKMARKYFPQFDKHKLFNPNAGGQFSEMIH